MLYLRAAVAVASLSILAGCATRQDLESIRVALEGNPQLQAELTAKCAQEQRLGKRDTGTLKGLMGITSDADVPRTFCARIYSAVASGRLTYDDYLAASRNELTPSLARILKG